MIGGYDWSADERVSYRFKGIPLTVGSVKYIAVKPPLKTSAQGQEGELWEVEFVNFFEKEGFITRKHWIEGKWIRKKGIEKSSGQ